MDYLHDIYRLAYIKRYSNIPKVHEESVAEHGFFVAAIVMGLNDEYDFNLGIALQIAVSHDMPELELNDCPYIIKKKYPNIKEAFKESEKEVLKQMPIAVKQGCELFEDGQSIEAKVCILADAMQCLQFSKVEINLGNHGYMVDVYNTSYLRVVELKEELKRYEKQ